MPENKYTKFRFESGEKIKLFKWLLGASMFRNGQFRKGKLSLQFKNVLRVIVIVIILLSTPLRAFQG